MRHRGGGSVRALPAALAALLAAATWSRAAHAGPWGDSLATRFEAGLSTDVSNEQFYDEIYADTTFLGRRLTSLPETRRAFVAALETSGARGALAWTVHDDAVLGDELVRAASRASLGRRAGDGVELRLEPELEALRDRSFGSDRREASARVDGRARFGAPGAADLFELLAGGEWLRSSGASDFLVLDRNLGRARARWSHQPLDGAGADVAWEAQVRTFPDSIVRDHVEQRVSADLRRDLGGGVGWAIAGDLGRRSTLRAAPTTLDRFWNGHGEATLTARLGPVLAADAALEIEGYRYDAPDSVVYFDYDLCRAHLGLRWDLDGGWTVTLEPRYEWLRSAANPFERYHEPSLALEFERFARGGWWSLEPSAGWRAYDESASQLSARQDVLHSPYLYGEVEGFVDQPLPGHVRLRVLGTGRIERHDDPSQDARSLYFSVDVRRLF